MELWITQLFGLCVGQRRKVRKVHEMPAFSSKEWSREEPHETAEAEGAMRKSLRLHHNFNSTSCAHCNNMIFLSAKNYREARVGGSSFLFCRDKCWEEWMAWFCSSREDDVDLEVESDPERCESPNRLLSAVPEDLKRTYSLRGLAEIGGNRPLSGVTKRTSLGVL